MIWPETSYPISSRLQVVTFFEYVLVIQQLDLLTVLWQHVEKSKKNYKDYLFFKNIRKWEKKNQKKPRSLGRQDADTVVSKSGLSSFKYY